MHFIKRTLLLAIIFFNFSNNAQSNTIYVDQSAVGVNNGTSWQNAFKDLADALKLTDSVNSIDTILIAAGIYKPKYNAHTFDTTGNSVAFWIKRDNLSIIGGYAPGGNTYNPSIYKSILSGDIGIPNESSDNCKKILYIASDNNYNYITNIYLENLVIKDAYSYYIFSYYPMQGYNIYITDGGAIAGYYSNFKLKNCHIVDNYAYEKGGGVYTFHSNTVFENCIFENNQSDRWGGALYLNNGNDSIINCTFINNSAVNKGGAINAHFNNMNILKSNFKQNKVDFRGGAIYSYSGRYITINNNIFDSNYTFDISDALDIEYSNSIDISNNIIKNHKNGAYTIGLNNNNQVKISNNILANNDGSQSVNFMINSSIINLEKISNIFISNNLILNNKSTRLIYNIDNTNTTFQNNIISHNYITTLLLENKITDTIRNNFYHNNPILLDNLNSSLDPMFVKLDTIFERSDYRLQFCSPLINAGSNYGITATTDILGNTRIADSLIDIGPYEKQSNDIISKNATLASISHNGTVLSPTCEEDGWTYYATSKAADSVVLGIKWDSLNEAVKNRATVMIKVDSTHTLLHHGSNEGIATLPRYWNIDIDTNTLLTPIAVRFYYASQEIDAMLSHFRTQGIDSFDGPVWFTMNEAFIPNLHVVNNDINNGNYTIIIPTIDTTNGINSVQFDNLMSIKSGGAFVKGSQKTTSIKNAYINNGITAYPNPAANHINLAVKNSTIIGQEAQVLDMHGRVIATFEVKTNNSLDISNFASGVYVIKVETSTIKFIKQ